ncbi:sulfite exporter TauE/SafE family protein [Nannocystaceae bacterium ST9]
MPFAPALLAATLAVVFLAALVRTTWGFGDAVVAIPLLSLLVSMQVASPMLVMVSIVLSLLLLRRGMSLLDFGVIARLLLGALAGIPLGLLVLTDLPESLARKGLGGVLLGFAIWSLIRARRAKPALAREPTPPLALAKALPLDLGFGVLVGACSAAFDISGPVLLIHATARRWTPEQLRMNLQAVFLPLGLLTMTGHALSGLWTRDVLLLAAWCLPVVMLARVFGERLRVRLEGQRGVVVLYLLIFALGVLMLAV